MFEMNHLNYLSHMKATVAQAAHVRAHKHTHTHTKKVTGKHGRLQGRNTISFMV